MYDGAEVEKDLQHQPFPEKGNENRNLDNETHLRLATIKAWTGVLSCDRDT